jgi:hypothetical protein
MRADSNVITLSKQKLKHKITEHMMKFGPFTAMGVHIVVFWFVTSCSVVDVLEEHAASIWKPPTKLAWCHNPDDQSESSTSFTTVYASMDLKT